MKSLLHAFSKTQLQWPLLLWILERIGGIQYPLGTFISCYLFLFSRLRFLWLLPLYGVFCFLNKVVLKNQTESIHSNSKLKKAMDYFESIFYVQFRLPSPLKQEKPKEWTILDIFAIYLFRFTFNQRDEKLCRMGCDFVGFLGLLTTPLFVEFVSLELKNLNQEMKGFLISKKKIDIDFTNSDKESETPFENELMIYIHGGGFHCGSPIQQMDYYQRLIAKNPNLVIFAIEYPLCPEHSHLDIIPYLENSFAFWRSLRHIKRIYLSGDSAGGNLAATLAFICVSANQHEKLSGVLLHSPWMDISPNALPTFEESKFDIISPIFPNMSGEYAGQYAKGKSLFEPNISPMNYIRTKRYVHPTRVEFVTFLEETISDHAVGPQKLIERMTFPFLIITGDHDLFSDQIKSFARQCAELLKKDVDEVLLDRPVQDPELKSNFKVINSPLLPHDGSIMPRILFKKEQEKILEWSVENLFE